MKPLWVHTLAWVATVAAAVLLAWGGPELADRHLVDPIPHGAAAPR